MKTTNLTKILICFTIFFQLAKAENQNFITKLLPVQHKKRRKYIPKSHPIRQRVDELLAQKLRFRAIIEILKKENLVDENGYISIKYLKRKPTKITYQKITYHMITAWKKKAHKNHLKPPLIDLKAKNSILDHLTKRTKCSTNNILIHQKEPNEYIFILPNQEDGTSHLITSEKIKNLQGELQKAFDRKINGSKFENPLVIE